VRLLRVQPFSSSAVVGQKEPAVDRNGGHRGRVAVAVVVAAGRRVVYTRMIVAAEAVRLYTSDYSSRVRPCIDFVVAVARGAIWEPGFLEHNARKRGCTFHQPRRSPRSLSATVFPWFGEPAVTAAFLWCFSGGFPSLVAGIGTGGGEPDRCNVWRAVCGLCAWGLANANSRRAVRERLRKR
jgi:hypothetical protein